LGIGGTCLSLSAGNYLCIFDSFHGLRFSLSVVGVSNKCFGGFMCSWTKVAKGLGKRAVLVVP